MLEQMLDIQNLANNDVAAAICAASLRSRSGRLTDAAARKVMSKRELLDLLAIGDRMRFMISIGFTGVDSWTSQHIDPEYRQRLWFASYVGIVLGPLLLLVFGIPDIVGIASNPPEWGNFVWTLAIAVAAVAAVLAVRRSYEVTKRVLAGFIGPAFIFMIIIARLGALEFVAAVLEIVTRHFGYLQNLLGAYLYLWPISALYYLAIESGPTFRKFSFPFDEIASPLWSLLKNVTRLLWRCQPGGSS